MEVKAVTALPMNDNAVFAVFRFAPGALHVHVIHANDTDRSSFHLLVSGGLAPAATEHDDRQRVSEEYRDTDNRQ